MHGIRLKDKTLNTRLVCAVLASVVSIAAMGARTVAKSPSPRPTLVVGIFVEGLSADYVDLLRSNLTDNGFNRLIDDGVTLRNVDYGPGIDATAATAILVSGAAPAVNGIPSAKVWDVSTKRDYPVLLDPSLAGSYNEQQLTPAPLRVSTLSDEVRISDGGLGQIHALAEDSQVAILLGGHAGNSCFWISDIDGKWKTSTHFRETPSPIARRNVGLTLASRLDTMAWEPAMQLSLYPDLPEYKKLYPFRHTFPSRDTDRFRIFKGSPMSNREIVSTAAEYISTLSLGKRGVTDMISVGVDVSPYLYGREADNRIESMDAIVRLDRDIASIVEAVEKNGPGMSNTLLFVAGTPAPSGGKRDEERWSIPTGQFSPRKAVSLLNMYLMALHGNGEWVSGYHNGFFYLNRALIKERDMSDADIRREGAEFLSRMSGVSDVYTLDDILARRAGDNPVALHRNISPSHAGDLLVMVNPGWEISDGEEYEPSSKPSGTQLPVVRWQATTSPVYILAPTLSSTEIVESIDARAVAPTLAGILRIRSPNASSVAPVRVSVK